MNDLDPSKKNYEEGKIAYLFETILMSSLHWLRSPHITLHFIGLSRVAIQKTPVPTKPDETRNSRKWVYV